MMASEEPRLEEALGRLLERLAADPAARQALQALARWLLARLEEKAAPPPPAPPPRLARITLGGETVEVPVRDLPLQPEREGAAPAPTSSPPPEPDLKLAARRARLKAEGCRWAAERRRRLAENADFDTAIRPRDKELGGRARALPDCFLWMLDPYAHLPDDDTLEQLAGCYENLATAADLVRELLEAEDSPEYRERALELLAEAQSALRVAYSTRGKDARDTDQEEVFRWLRRYTHDEQVYIPRYMRLNDPADPGAWWDLSERLTGLREEVERERQDRRRRQQALNRLQYHTSRIREGRSTDLHHDWAVIAQTVRDLLARGDPPSAVYLREALLPVADQVPPDLEVPEALARVLQEIRRYREEQRTHLPPPPRRSEPTAEVAAVRRLLAGKTVLLIGGQRRPEAARALEDAFHLKELRWISSENHARLELFTPHVRDPEVALVLLAVRWSSHSYEQIKEDCRNHRKPFVRLPAGYNPNQVATQILNQVSEELQGGA